MTEQPQDLSRLVADLAGRVAYLEEQLRDRDRIASVASESATGQAMTLMNIVDLVARVSTKIDQMSRKFDDRGSELDQAFAGLGRDVYETKKLLAERLPGGADA